MRHIYIFLATGMYTGFSPVAPGTCGTVVGVLMFLLLGHLAPLPYIITILAFIALSVWVSDRAIEIFGREDPQQVVIDEIAGYLVAVAFHEVNMYIMIAGFVLFRIFDIAKPFPIGVIDRKVSGGVGVVMDDVLAGVYANVALWGVVFAARHFGLNIF